MEALTCIPRPERPTTLLTQHTAHTRPVGVPNLDYSIAHPLSSATITGNIARLTIRASRPCSKLKPRIHRCSLGFAGIWETLDLWPHRRLELEGD